MDKFVWLENIAKNIVWQNKVVRLNFSNFEALNVPELLYQFDVLS